MNMNWIKQYLLYVGAMALLGAGGCLVGGCTVGGRSKHNTEWYIRYGTEVAGGTRTAQTADVEAYNETTVTVDDRLLDNVIGKQKEAEDQPQP